MGTGMDRATMYHDAHEIRRSRTASMVIAHIMHGIAEAKRRVGREWDQDLSLAFAVHFFVLIIRLVDLTIRMSYATRYDVLACTLFPDTSDAK